MKALTKQDLMELGIDVYRNEKGEYLVRHYSRNNRSLERSLKVIKVSIIYKKHQYGLSDIQSNTKIHTESYYFLDKGRTE